MAIWLTVLAEGFGLFQYKQSRSEPSLIALTFGYFGILWDFFPTFRNPANGLDCGAKTEA